MTVLNMVVVNSTAAHWPGDGAGSVVNTVRGTSNAADEAFTETTGACSAWATANPSAWTVNDLVVTSDNHWGVYKSGNATTATVDRWRYANSVQPHIPAGLSDIKALQGTCIIVGSAKPTIKRIVITEVSINATASVSFYDAYGDTRIAGPYTVGTSLAIIDFTSFYSQGLVMPGLFSVVLSHNDFSALIEFTP